MGHATYSVNSARLRSTTEDYASRSVHEVFKSRTLTSAMNPHGVTVRECRDSVNHPNSLPVIIALDVTGSMGSVPKHFIAEGMADIMEVLQSRGVTDPSVLFLAIGDHECDSAPLQVGQFESGDMELETWLKTTYIEGGGGGNAGESYGLAWYFAAHHTVSDHMEKRGKKGFLFTIGDEPNLQRYPGSMLKALMGTAQASDMTAAELLEQARAKYEVFHIHITETPSGKRPGVQEKWRQLLAENVTPVQSYRDIPEVITQVLSRPPELYTEIEADVVHDEPSVESKPSSSDDILL